MISPVIRRLYFEAQIKLQGLHKAPKGFVNPKSFVKLCKATESSYVHMLLDELFHGLIQEVS